MDDTSPNKFTGNILFFSMYNLPGFNFFKAHTCSRGLAPGRSVPLSSATAVWFNVAKMKREKINRNVWLTNYFTLADGLAMGMWNYAILGM